MKSLLGLALACALVGCATNQTGNTTQQVEYACTGVTSAMQVLTVAAQRNKLSDADIAAVGKASDIVTPICTAEDVPTLDGLQMTIFRQAVAELETKAAGVK